MISRIMSRPIKVNTRSYREFERSFTALYVMNIHNDDFTVNEQDFESLIYEHSDFVKSVPIPEYVRKVAQYFVKLNAYRYVDLILIDNNQVFKVVSDSSMVPCYVEINLANRCIIPVVSSFRSFIAEGERGLVTGVTLAGYLIGRAHEMLDGKVQLHPKLDLPKTLLAPIALILD